MVIDDELLASDAQLEILQRQSRWRIEDLSAKLAALPVSDTSLVAAYAPL
jgi:hypothetical protein